MNQSSARESDKPAAAAAGSAAGLSAFASVVGLCCVGPWTVALLGVSGAITMARLEPARPYILAVAAALLAWAFWRVYQPRPQCVDGPCRGTPSIWLKLTLWLAAGLVLIAFFAEPLALLFINPISGGAGR